MTALAVLGSIIAVLGAIVAVDYLEYRREQDRKAEISKEKERLKNEISTGHNISRIQHLAHRVRK